MFVNPMPRYEILSEDAMATLDRGWRRHRSPRSASSSWTTARSSCSAAPARRSRADTSSSTPTSCSSRSRRRRASSTSRRATRRTRVHIGGDTWPSARVYGPPFVREGDVRRDATMEDFRNFTRLAQSFAELDSAGGVDLRAQRHPARLAAPRHDLRAADADRQDLHGQRRVRASTPRDTIAMSEILFGGREAIEQTPAIDLADQLQLAAALGRPDARRAVRVRRARTSPSC